MEIKLDTILDFEKKFSAEEACQQYLFDIRWPTGFHCPRCKHTEYWLTKRGLFFCRHCDYQASITSGTIFQDTRKPLVIWFRAIWYITNQKHGVSALGMQQALGLKSYRTAWSWLHKLRRAMVRPDREKLSGIVEVDEAYIGGEKSGKRGRGAAGKSLVFVAVEESGLNSIGRIRFKVIKKADAENLEKAIKECIDPGSIIRTDGWNGYNKISSLGYTRKVVRHTEDVGENLLCFVNIVVSLLKRWLNGTHQGAVQMSHLCYYLDEFTFRFNRRKSKSRGKLFQRLMEQAVNIQPIKGKELIGFQQKS
jgi:transposase-like protein